MDEHAKKSASLFRKESLSRISSPDKLDEYLRTTSVSSFYLLAAAVILILSLFIWSVLGKLPTVIKANGIVSGGEAVCYCDDISDVSVGQQVNLNDGSTGSVIEVSQRPISLSEAALLYDDYDMYMLELNEWNYKITISAPDAPDGYTAVSIITGKTAPISFMLN